MSLLLLSKYLNPVSGLGNKCEVGRSREGHYQLTTRAPCHVVPGVTREIRDGTVRYESVNECQRWQGETYYAWLRVTGPVRLEQVTPPQGRAIDT